MTELITTLRRQDSTVGYVMDNEVGYAEGSLIEPFSSTKLCAILFWSSDMLEGYYRE